MFQLGLKIGSRDTQYTDDILRYYDAGIFQYIELFAISGSYKETISYWKQFDIPIGIHAPHSAAGLNLSNSLFRSENLRKIAECYKFADTLKSDYIIFHSGTNGNLEEVIQQLKIFSDERLLIENKPVKGLDGSICIGSTYEELDIIINFLGKGCGFVLDFGHAICAANSKRVDPISFIEELIKLRPRLFHLTDGDYKSELDSHLHYGNGNFPLNKLMNFIPDGEKITNEASRNNDSLEEVKNDSVFLQNLIAKL